MTNGGTIQTTKETKVEFWFGVLSLGGMLLIDVLQGMVIGLLGSLLFVIYRLSKPHIALLGRVPGMPGAYSDLTRHPENTPVPGILIVCIDAMDAAVSFIEINKFAKRMKL